MSVRLKVLVVGGYGTFGGRLVDLLADEPRLTLLVAGRSLDRASAFCETRSHAKAQIVPAAFDRNGDLAEQFAAHGPGIVVDASGPFQACGEGRYRLIEACIARGVHYLDLADGSAFVAGVKAFDAAARAAGIAVLSGVSSFPVLTAAAARRLSAGLARVRAIRGGIAPSPYAGVGTNVIRAIASYAGKSVPLERNGTRTTGYPFTESIRFTIAPPGRLPLRNTLFSLVDVPDLQALADLWPEAEAIWMGAGPVPEILHRALIAFAWLVRLRLAPSLSPLAPLMHYATNHLRWGEHRGGMFVAVTGDRADGMPIEREWHLIADGDDGPLIPSMAAEALIRKMLAGQVPVPGARAAVRELELHDYETLFARRTIHTGIREVAPKPAAPLYANVLGAAWHDLPVEIRSLHTVESARSFAGRCTVERGASMLSKMVAWMFGFPGPGADVPVAVRFEAADGAETWTRTFAGRSFSSHQSAGRGRSARLLCERFGPLTFAMALVTGPDRLDLVLRRWSAFGIPLPLWLGPRSKAFETVDGGRFRFHVEIGHPLTGLVVRYRGWLAER